MSTSAVVARPSGDGFEGRFVQWDGYPSGVGLAVYQIAQRDGAAAAARTIIDEHEAWATLTAQDRSPRGRDEWQVPGYGEAPPVAAGSWYTQLITTSTIDEVSVQWVYVICSGGLLVTGGTSHVVSEMVPWGLDDQAAVDVFASIKSAAQTPVVL